MKTQFSFRPINLISRKCYCDPVVASVRKSEPNKVVIRIDPATAAKCLIKTGTKLATFIDEQNRALLLTTDPRPEPPGVRRAHGKGSVSASIYLDLPRVGPLAKWFPGTSIQPMTLVEASPGRLAFQVPS